MPERSLNPVRVGVVGLGYWGGYHLGTLANLAEVRVVAVVDPRADVVNAQQAKMPGVRGFTELDRALAETDAEAWIVASPTATHVPIARQLLSKGKTVLLEKPIAGSLAEAQQLAPLVKPDSINLMIGHIVLFNSEFCQLRTEVQRRGPIKYLSAYRHRSTDHLTHFPGETPFHLTMVHDLYLAYVLMDRAEPIAFSAQAHRTNGACDLALAQLRWESGAVATFAASFLCPPAMGFEGFDRMEVFGEGWAARLLPNPRPITVWDERTVHPMPMEARADDTSATGMLAEEHRCFCRVVRGQEPVPVGATYRDAMRVLEWLDRLSALALAK